MKMDYSCAGQEGARAGRARTWKGQSHDRAPWLLGRPSVISGRDFTFAHPDRSFQSAITTALQEAGEGGCDSLNVLLAVLDTSVGSHLITTLGVSPAAIRDAAIKSPSAREAGPGLTEDAKAVIEEAVQRALVTGSAPDVAALLVGLTQAPCLARPILEDHGITAARVIALIEQSRQ